jgi:tetratricopeptide (TPR) repeat protein
MISARTEEKVTKALTLKLTGEEKEQLVKRHTEDTNAYEFYLRGRYFWNKRTPTDFKKAIECFQKAIEIDSNYALAYSGLADCYIHASAYSVLPPKEYLPKAEAVAFKALKIDDKIVEAHASLAFYRTHTWDWSGAESEYRRALELNPNYATAHQWYSIYLRVIGRFDEAIAEITMALELDPLSLSFNAGLGLCLYFARRYDQAIGQLLKVVDLEPNFGITYFFLGLTYAEKKMHNEAITSYKKGLTLLASVPEILAYIGHAYAISGRKNEAQKVLDELVEMLPQSYVEPYFIATIYAALDEKDQAFIWLEKGFEDHIASMANLKIDPMLDSLRGDPRFESLLQRMGLMANKGEN